MSDGLFTSVRSESSNPRRVHITRSPRVDHQLPQPFSVLGHKRRTAELKVSLRAAVQKRRVPYAHSTHNIKRCFSESDCLPDWLVLRGQHAGAEVAVEVIHVSGVKWREAAGQQPE